MTDLERSVDRIASQTGFSRVVRVDRGGEVKLVKAHGLAHRGREIPNEVDTRFGIASGTKGFTALTVMSLIQEGRLSPTTTACSVLDRSVSGSRRTRSDPGRCRVTTGTSRCPRAPSRSEGRPRLPA
jgi:CubicO group peptidase (beta-lactamase class C family)